MCGWPSTRQVHSNRGCCPVTTATFLRWWCRQTGNGCTLVRWTARCACGRRRTPHRCRRCKATRTTFVSQFAICSGQRWRCRQMGNGCTLVRWTARCACGRRRMARRCRCCKATRPGFVRWRCRRTGSGCTLDRRTARCACGRRRAACFCRHFKATRTTFGRWRCRRTVSGCTLDRRTGQCACGRRRAVCRCRR